MYHIAEENPNKLRLKLIQNAQLVNEASYELDLPTIYAAVIDTSIGNSTKALIDAGVPPNHIVAVNVDESNVPRLGNEVFVGDFTQYIAANGGTHRLDYIYYDGTSTLPKIYKDMYHMFDILADTAFIAITASHRASMDWEDVVPLPETFPAPYTMLRRDYTNAYTDADNWNEYYVSMLMARYAYVHGYTCTRILEPIKKASTVMLLRWVVERKPRRSARLMN